MTKSDDDGEDYDDDDGVEEVVDGSVAGESGIAGSRKTDDVMMEIDWKDGGVGVDGDYGCYEAAWVGVDKRRRMKEVGQQSTWVIAQAPELALKLDAVVEKGLQVYLHRQVMNDSRWGPTLQLWRHLVAAVEVRASQ